jgi:NIPSNAP
MEDVELVVQRFSYADAAGYRDQVAGGSIWPAGTARKIAAWQVTTGPLNRGLLLRTRSPEAAVAGPGAAEARTREFPLLSESVVRLEDIKPFAFPGEWARLYEFRVYTLHHGLGDRFSGLMRDILPTREKYSPNAGTWRTRSGHADRVIHVWAYRDLTERDGLRPAINADPGWQRYVADVTPLIADMRSMLLAPLAMETEQDKR